MWKTGKASYNELIKEETFTQTRSWFWEYASDSEKDEVFLLYNKMGNDLESVLKSNYIPVYKKQSGNLGYIHTPFVEAIRWFAGDHSTNRLLDKEFLVKELEQRHSEEVFNSEKEFEEFFCAKFDYVKRQGKTPYGRFDVLTEDTVWEVKLKITKIRDAISAYSQAMEYKEHLGIEQVGVASYVMTPECSEWLKSKGCKTFFLGDADPKREKITTHGIGPIDLQKAVKLISIYPELLSEEDIQILRSVLDTV